ncbi:MAG: helix-turn-helix transcriptional regulator [Chryseobacterium taeanense]
MINIGSLIKKYREENNISQEDMADELNVSQSKLSKIENGKLKISLVLALVIFRQLSLTAQEILEILENISL